MIFLSILTLLLGLEAGYLLSKHFLKKKLVAEHEESLRLLRQENELKDKELLQLKQGLADITYKYSELEKDQRSLVQKIERLEK